jgi:hypothetical protein
LDLQQLVSAFGFVVGGVWLLVGWRMRRVNLGVAILSAVFGGLLVVAAVWSVADLQRHGRVSVFPVHVLDLHAPPAAIEAARPPAPPPAETSTAAAASGAPASSVPAADPPLAAPAENRKARLIR